MIWERKDLASSLQIFVLIKLSLVPLLCRMKRWWWLVAAGGGWWWLVAAGGGLFFCIDPCSLQLVSEDESDQVLLTNDQCVLKHRHPHTSIY